MQPKISPCSHPTAVPRCNDACPIGRRNQEALRIAYTHQTVSGSGPLEPLLSWTSSLKAGYIANQGILLHAAWPGKKRRMIVAAENPPERSREQRSLSDAHPGFPLQQEKRMIVFLVDSCPPSCPVLPVRIARFALATCERKKEKKKKKKTRAVAPPLSFGEINSDSVCCLSVVLFPTRRNLAATPTYKYVRMSPRNITKYGPPSRLIPRHPSQSMICS